MEKKRTQLYSIYIITTTTMQHALAAMPTLLLLLLFYKLIEFLSKNLEIISFTPKIKQKKTRERRKKKIK